MIVLAVAAVHAVGGMDALKMKLGAIDQARGARAGSVLNFIPDLTSPWMPMMTFFVYISLNWWASWYPGAEPGGGGYIAQRMFSRQGRKELAARDAVVQHCQLRAAALAVDSGRAGVAGGFSGIDRIRNRDMCG